MFFKSRKTKDEPRAEKKPNGVAGPTRAASSTAGSSNKSPSPQTTPSTQAADPKAAEQLRRRRLDAKMKAAGFGEIIAVLMRSPRHKDLTLKELEARVLPAVLRGLFVVAEGHSKAKGPLGPLAAVLWAKVNSQVDTRLTQGKETALAASEWHCGDIPWIVEAVGDRRVLAAVIKRLQGNEFKGRAPKMILTDKATGKVTVGVVDATSRQAPA